MVVRVLVVLAVLVVSVVVVSYRHRRVWWLGLVLRWFGVLVVVSVVVLVCRLAHMVVVVGGVLVVGRGGSGMWWGMWR